MGCHFSIAPAIEQRQRAMAEAMSKGQFPDNEEIIALAECQEPCEQAFRSCYMSRSQK